MRKQKQEEASAGAPLWMTTFSDMVTLLLAFFVLLFAFSSIDVLKFMAVMSAFRGNVSVLDGGRAIITDSMMQTQDRETELEQLRELYEKLQEFLSREGLEGSVFLEFEERGLTLRFADQVLFDLGRADIKPEARQILRRLLPILSVLPNPIRIEGHTDNLPINTLQFPSNWELSTHRATNVIRFLTEQEELNPRQLSAAGYGEFRPVVPNTSPENRALNRRVDIVIMRLDLWDQEPM